MVLFNVQLSVLAPLAMKIVQTQASKIALKISGCVRANVFLFSNLVSSIACLGSLLNVRANVCHWTHLAKTNVLVLWQIAMESVLI